MLPFSNWANLQLLRNGREPLTCSPRQPVPLTPLQALGHFSEV